LGVPGADIRAAARDHTLEAAIFKVGRRLEDAILNRRTEEDLRHKGRPNSRVVVDQLTS
jgi:hypothetical protein